MSRPVYVLRPEPGNGRTVTALAAAGLKAVAMPAFAIRAVDWSPPAAARYDALLVTSANAVRHAGAGLAALSHLPVVAVGEATAAAARAAGLAVRVTGNSDAAEVIADAARAGFSRLLHLAGHDRTAATARIDAVTVYASDAIDTPAIPEDAIVLIHSARAAGLVASRIPPDARAGIALVAIAAGAAAAAGDGWQQIRIAAAPDDAAMIAAARAIDRAGGGGDKAA